MRQTALVPSQLATQAGQTDGDRQLETDHRLRREVNLARLTAWRQVGLQGGQEQGVRFGISTQSPSRLQVRCLLQGRVGCWGPPGLKPGLPPDLQPGLKPDLQRDRQPALIDSQPSARAMLDLRQAL